MHPKYPTYNFYLFFSVFVVLTQCLMIFIINNLLLAINFQCFSIAKMKKKWKKQSRSLWSNRIVFVQSLLRLVSFNHWQSFYALWNLIFNAKLFLYFFVAKCIFIIILFALCLMIYEPRETMKGIQRENYT